MTTPPYSEATVALVAAAIAAARDDDVFTEVEWNGSHWDGLRDAYRVDARAALDALAAAGLLLPEGAETQWGLRHHDRESVSPYASREVAERWREVSQLGWHLVSRPVGPWSAVPPEPKESA